jgi:hypothetical protein
MFRRSPAYLNPCHCSLVRQTAGDVTMSDRRAFPLTRKSPGTSGFRSARGSERGSASPVGIQGSGRSPSATPVLPASTGFSAGSEHVKRAADTNIARTRTLGVAHTSMMPYFVDLQTQIAAPAAAFGLVSRFLSKWLPGSRCKNIHI